MTIENINSLVGNVYEESETLRFEIIGASNLSYLVKYIRKGYLESYTWMEKRTFVQMNFKQIFIPKPQYKIRVIE